jgi:alpha-galactosidase/6-phospho-beta-glucosidase family protein
MTKITESRANSLRAYAEQLLESDNTILADEEISGLVDDLIEFAEQWEAELIETKSDITSK